MLIFEKTAAEQAKINAFLTRADQTLSQLAPYADYLTLTDLRRVRDSFVAKTDDFYRSDRKLNIGVIGQVKAGKSTFLNTLLFDGADVLPSARTPKTATLTKIEYAETNSICVEYYNPEEWSLLEEYSRCDISDNEHDVAREIMNMVSKNGIDPREYLERGTDAVQFESVDALMGQLNEYVGENGRLTPMVKNVTIRMNRPELAEISVVDTPGLNDAIASRTDKTREFIEKCDVVFFLSRASQFIDGNDMKLITSQLPQKGVEHLVLVCSRFDDGLLDELRKVGSLRGTMDKVKAALCTQSAEIVKRAKADGGAAARVLEQCHDPIFISSMLYNMAQKPIDSFSRNEAFVYKKLNKFGDLTPELMLEIGNMDCVKTLFQKIVSDKDATLQQKAIQFLPRVHDEWNAAVRMMSEEAKRKLQVLEAGDREKLGKQKKAMESQISGIKASLETVLGDLMIALEQTKADNLRKLRENCRECSRLEEKTGTEWHTSSHMVGQKSFLWFKWGGHRETTSYSTTYTYLATSDALENVRTFGYDACSDIEAAFQRAVDVKATKRRLLQTILDNFDSGDENFDINHFRHITEATLNRLEFPVLKIDIDPFLNAISSKFSGEVRDSSSRSNLQSLLAETMDQLFEAVTSQFTASVTNFRASIDKMQGTFQEELLRNIQEEFDLLQKQFENKEQEITKYHEAIQKLSDSQIS
ncbi:dynamin family protein [uncultured Ruminococcus sp.]|uniref:dynamin family protein n=1 Tax=uncultured Ruminococcus sp. TaxID=165186 RepID=UPI00261F7E3D|nr:dynamin family protein [uncultured Ruminococcus sp.]